MTINEVLQLIRAGYTKAEIDTMIAAETPSPAADPAPDLNMEQQPAEQTPDPSPAEATEPGPTPEPAKTEPTETEKLLAALGMKLDRMTTALQASNVQHLQQPDTGLTAEKVLAQIINPHAT